MALVCSSATQPTDKELQLLVTRPEKSLQFFIVNPVIHLQA